GAPGQEAGSGERTTGKRRRKLARRGGRGVAAWSPPFSVEATPGDPGPPDALSGGSPLLVAERLDRVEAGGFHGRVEAEEDADAHRDRQAHQHGPEGHGRGQRDRKGLDERRGPQTEKHAAEPPQGREGHRPRPETPDAGP